MYYIYISYVDLKASGGRGNGVGLRRANNNNNNNSNSSLIICLVLLFMRVKHYISLSLTSLNMESTIKQSAAPVPNCSTFV